MITRDEIYRSVYGAWQLFLDKPDAQKHFDLSYDGFWRSFQVILVIAPLYAIWVWSYFPSDAALETFGIEDKSIVAWASALGLVIDWFTLPILLAALAPTLGLARTYAPYIVVRNWATLLLVIPNALVAALDAALGVPAELTYVAVLLLLAAGLRLSYLAARRVLEASFGLAIGIVVLDFFLSLFIQTGVNLLFGLPAEV